MKLASVARPFQTAMLAVGTVLAAATTWGDIFYVSPTGTNTAAFTRTDPGDLRTAINTKTSSTRTSWDNGDVVCLLPGTYDFSEWSSAGNLLTCNKPYLTVRSDDGKPETCVILGRGDDVRISEDGLTTNTPPLLRAFYLTKNTRIIGLTVTHFYCQDNGAAVCEYTKTPYELRDCVFGGNRTTGNLMRFHSRSFAVPLLCVSAPLRSIFRRRGRAAPFTTHHSPSWRLHHKAVRRGVEARAWEVRAGSCRRRRGRAARCAGGRCSAEGRWCSHRAR